MKRLAYLMLVAAAFLYVPAILTGCDGEGTNEQCEPACSGKECGDDGCGGTCGTCSEDLPVCFQGACVELCEPACDGKTCGPDGCGGDCGECDGDLPVCAEEVCISDCVPDCTGAACGEDGCGGTCGECDGAQDECVDGLCVCQPACEEIECGEDGCGGTCGECDGAQDECVEGLCVCQPACDGMQCGSDGCGDVCGVCPGDQDDCIDGECICQLDCNGKECGTDGCEGECGECHGLQIECVEGICQCVPACDGLECGDDGCEGLCGACAETDVCVEGICCTPQCDGKVCGDDLCGGLCGECPGEQDLCLEGECICQPDCEGKVCGSDGCADSCGICEGEGELCFDGACCVPSCEDKVCGSDGCGGTCGNGNELTGGCPAFDVCDEEIVDCIPLPPPDMCEGKDCGPDGIGGDCGDCPCQDCGLQLVECQAWTCIPDDGVDCAEIFECFDGCLSGDTICFQNCISSGTPEAQVIYNALIGCLQGSGYFDCMDGDDACYDATFEACMDPYYECLHGELPCVELYVCLMGCPGGDVGATCRSGCFSSVTIESLEAWDFFIDCLDANGYYDCDSWDPDCTDLAWEACDDEFKACAHGDLTCNELYACLLDCDPWDNTCRLGCLVHGTIEAQELSGVISDCVNEYCDPVLSLACEQEALLTDCFELYAQCIDPEYVVPEDPPEEEELPPDQ